MAEQTIKEGEPKMTLLEELKLLLEKDGRLVSEGKLLKNRIVELALKLDKDLIKLLLSNERIKTHFFTEVDKILVFDKEKFMKFVDNKEFLPDSYTAFKNKIGLTADKNYIAQSKEVVLSWPYKDCILEGGQEKTDEKRKEIFHNEILAPDEIDRLLEPKVFTNFKRVDVKGEHEVKEIKPTDNLIIKGNNLLVLHSLKKRFAGKVKMIYIDPPYNTGNDEFKYNDSFNHSTWLTFMKNRLEIAKELLRDDGVIFVQGDDNEQAYLKVLMDEVFRRENFVSILKIQMRNPERQLSQKAYFQKSIEYILLYSKNNSEFNIKKEEIKYDFTEYRYKIIEKSKGEKRTIGNKEVFVFKPNEYEIVPCTDINEFRILKSISIRGKIKTAQHSGKFYEKYLRSLLESDGRDTLYKVMNMGDDGIGFRYIKQPSNETINGVYYQGIPQKYRENIKDASKTRSWSDFYNFVEDNIRAGEFLKEIFGKKVFGTPKPVSLIKWIISISTGEDDVILDFFAGSGTTGHAVLECNKEDSGNRQFILCEQLDYVDMVTVPRVQKVIEKLGCGDFVYCELMELNEKFIQKIQEAKNTEELLKIWDEMKEHAFLSYKIEPKDIDENIEEFKNLSFEDQKRFLIEILDKNDLYVNYSEIEDNQYKISEEDKKLNKKFYGGEL